MSQNNHTAPLTTVAAKEPRTQIRIDIARPLNRALEMKAADLECTKRQVIVNALCQYLGIEAAA